MSIAKLRKQIISTLKAAGITGAQTDAELIMSFVLKKDRTWLMAHDTDELASADTERMKSLAQRRAQREPLSYVLGQREFAGLMFSIDNRALTPRVETETIVAEVTKGAPKRAAVLDVGTGSGAMAIALKRLRPDLVVTASEVSSSALELAQENAARLLERENTITFLESDLFDNVPGSFDIIVANLPYVTREMELMPEVEREPAVALFGGAPDGLDLYRKFFTQLPKHLNENGQIWLESDPWQQEALIALAAAQGLEKTFQDYFILGFCLTT